MAERTLTCPLCDYQTIVWDDETHWCPDCFNSREPALSGVSEMLSMSSTPSSSPLLDLIKSLVNQLRSDGFDELQIYVGYPVKKELMEETEEMMLVTNGDYSGQMPPLHIYGYQVSVPESVARNEVTVIDESAMARGVSIRGYETVQLPWEVLEDDD